MKRDPSLISLSRDHHKALLASQKLLTARADTAEKALADLRAYWDAHGQAHFRAEEEVLFPAYAGHADANDPLLARVLSDHLAIRQRVHALNHDLTAEISALHELGRLINDHVRLEERKLFPLIEAALPAAELIAVGTALDRATTTRSN